MVRQLWYIHFWFQPTVFQIWSFATGGKNAREILRFSEILASQNRFKISYLPLFFSGTCHLGMYYMNYSLLQIVKLRKRRVTKQCRTSNETGANKKIDWGNNLSPICSKWQFPVSHLNTNYVQGGAKGKGRTWLPVRLLKKWWPEQQKLWLLYKKCGFLTKIVAF